MMEKSEEKMLGRRLSAAEAQKAVGKLRLRLSQHLAGETSKDRRRSAQNMQQKSLGQRTTKTGNDGLDQGPGRAGGAGVDMGQAPATTTTAAAQAATTTERG